MARKRTTRGTPSPLSPERVAIETRLVAAMSRKAEDIADVLHTFTWVDHLELACLALGELVNRNPRSTQVDLAEKMAPFCKSVRRTYCTECPLFALQRKTCGDDDD